MTSYFILIVGLLWVKGEANSKLFCIISLLRIKQGIKSRRSFADLLDLVHSMSPGDWDNTVDWTGQNSKTLLSPTNSNQL